MVQNGRFRSYHVSKPWISRKWLILGFSGFGIGWIWGDSGLDPSRSGPIRVPTHPDPDPSGSRPLGSWDLGILGSWDLEDLRILDLGIWRIWGLDLGIWRIWGLDLVLSLPDPGSGTKYYLIYTFTRARGREKTSLMCVTCVLHPFLQGRNCGHFVKRALKRWSKKVSKSLFWHIWP